MAEYEFKCPECGETGLNEIMSGVTVDSEIDRITDDDGIVYGDQTNTDGQVENICCRNCGVILRVDGGVDRFSPDGSLCTLACVTTHEELIEWLEKNK